MARSGGVQGLTFVLYVYEDHGVVAVTRRDYLPLTGPSRRLGSVRVACGRKDLAGLAPSAAVKLVAAAILTEMSEPSATIPSAQRSGSPLGDMGVPGQLALDIGC